MIKKYRDSLIVFISLIVFGAITYSLSFYIPSLLIGLGYSYLFARKILSPEYFRSKLYVLVVSLFMYVGVMQMVIYLSWKIVPTSSILLNTLIMAGVSGVAYIALSLRKSPKLPTFSRGDLASLAASLIFVVMVFYIPLYHAVNMDRGNILNLVNKGVDDSPHIGTLNDRLYFKSAGYTDEIVESGKARQDGNGYPLGWHNANAVFILSVKPDIRIGYESVIAYVITKVFWVCILVYLLGASAFNLFKNQGRQRKRNYAVGYWILLSTLLFSVWFISDSVFFGFYNYIGILAVVPIFLLAITQLLRAKKPLESLEGLLLPIMLSAIVVLSWILVAPVFIIATIIAFFYSLDLSKLKRSILRSELVPIYSGLGVLLLLFVASFLIQTTQTSSGVEVHGGLFGILLVPGGIITYTTGFFVAIIIGLIPLFYIYRDGASTTRKTIESLILLMTTSLVIAAVIYTIQMYYNHKLEYYFYKSFNISIFIAIIAVIGGVSYMLSKSKASQTFLFATITSSILFAAFTLYPNPTFVYNSRATQSTSPKANRVIRGALELNQDEAIYLNNNLTLFATAGDSPINPEVANMLLKSNRPYSNCFKQAHGLLLTKAPADITKDDLFSLECDRYNVTLLVEPEELEELSNTVASSGLDNFSVTPIPTDL